jgi:hypothetical protein
MATLYFYNIFLFCLVFLWSILCLKINGKNLIFPDHFNLFSTLKSKKKMK